MLPGTMPILAADTMVGVPQLTAAASLSDEIQYNSAASVAQITLDAFGEIMSYTSALGSYDSGDWLDPKTGMSQFSSRWTNTSGAITIGTAAIWESLASPRTYGISIDSGLGAATCTGTLEIARTDDAAKTVLATKSGIALHVYSSPLTPP
jgi:hypothetical protein